MSKGATASGGGGIDWSEIGLWTAAGIVIAGLHAAGAWYIHHQTPNEPVGSPDAPIMIDVAPLPAPVVEQPIKEEVPAIEPEPTIEPPVEEQSAESKIQPEPEVEPQTEMEPEPLPEPIEEITPKPEIAEPVPEIPEPVEEPQEEIVELPKAEVPLPVVRPAPEKLQERKKPIEKAVRRPVERKTVTAPVTAREPREVQQRSAALSSAASARQAQKWSARVQAYLVRRTRSARTSGEGTVRVSFVVTRSGEIISASIVGSSGLPQLDQSVLDAVRRASPVPAAPDDVAAQRQSFTVPFLIR